MPSCSIIAAAGAIGEARLVARQLRQWIDAGTAANGIVVTARDLPGRLALWREVFDDYAVPAVFPVEMIGICGALKFLRKAWLIPARGFAFREVASLWRNQYFQPAFEPDLQLRADVLLRQMNAGGGRDEVLDAVQRTAEDRLPLPLEDETMDQTRAERSQLAKRCLGFVQWFYRLWDAIPNQAAPREMVAALRTLAGELGFAKDPADEAAAIELFWTTLEARAAAAKQPTVTTAEFDRVLGDILAKTPWSKPAGDGVHVLSIEETLKKDCTHLIVAGCGERTFPRVTGPENLEATLAAERALFDALLQKPAHSLVLSYEAIDVKGQAQLPAAYLADLQTQQPGLPVKSQTMPLDGYLKDPPISAAEMRTQAAKNGTFNDPHLIAAQCMALSRFQANEPNAYNGKLADAGVKAFIAARFQPERVFSATSLENYVGCPFRFAMGKVLGLEPLQEPDEDVNASARGTTIHRALRRYHEANVNDLHASWNGAVDEAIERAPGPVTKTLWQLERRRVQRSLDRYPQHWSRFKEGWLKLGVTLEPSRFEAMFGYDREPPLTIENEGVRVRIGGIIDRVDVAKLDQGLGFWVIDYKTGGTAYTNADVLNYETLQLPLYALAVERIFHATELVRLLGLAYWLVVKDGPKRMLPTGRDETAWVRSDSEWNDYRGRLEAVVTRIAASLRSGDFRLAPRHRKTCEHCDYATICRINQLRGRFEPLALIG